MSNIEYSSDIDFSQVPIRISEIEAILPNWKTRINEIYQFNSSKLVQLDFIVAAKTEADVTQWLLEYYEKTKASYSIRSTEKCSGYKVRFKQRLNCQHNTGNPKLYEQSVSRRTRNTNCPANISVTLRKVGKRYQGKDKSKAPNPEMPCEIRLIPFHNHSTESADVLRFRQVSPQTKDKLTKLFEAGHSPGTALQTIKFDIQINYDNYCDILVDRSVCPDYMYVYHLYTLIYKRKYKPIEASREFLQEKVDVFNRENGYCSAKIHFVDDDYVICLCPPLMQRVHETIEEASEVVYIISNSVSEKKVSSEQKVSKEKLSSDQKVTSDQENNTYDQDPSDQKDPAYLKSEAEQNANHIFVLLTSTDCGGLPLAILITSSDCCHLISAGFQLLKEFLGDKIFYGAADGPAVFMIDDSAAEQAAINSEWPNSTVLLSSFHVLRSIWKWLIKAKNEIYLEHVHDLYQQFKNVMFANTESECEAAYRVAQEESARYPQYRKCLRQYWNRRPLWALCYTNYLKRCDSNVTEASMRLLTDNIFDRIKSFTLLQTTDFVMTRFARCFEKRLVEVASNRPGRSVLQRLMPEPAREIVNGIENFAENTHLVPCEKDHNLLYIVNTEILICTCVKGRTGNVCKHIWWVCGFVIAEKFIRNVDDEALRKKYFYVAVGKQSTADRYESLFGESSSADAIPQRFVKIEFRPAEMSTEVPVENLTDISDVNVQVNESEGETIVKGSDVINEITRRFCEFLTQSPAQVCQALETFNAQLKEIKSPSEFVTGCLGFSLATSAIDLPKANLSEKRKNATSQTTSVVIKKKRKK